MTLIFTTQNTIRVQSVFHPWLKNPRLLPLGVLGVLAAKNASFQFPSIGLFRVAQVLRFGRRPESQRKVLSGRSAKRLDFLDDYARHFPVDSIYFPSGKLKTKRDMMNQSNISGQPKSNRPGERAEPRHCSILRTRLTTYDRRFSRGVESHVEIDWKDISTWDAPKCSGARRFCEAEWNLLSIAKNSQWKNEGKLAGIKCNRLIAILIAGGSRVFVCQDRDGCGSLRSRHGGSASSCLPCPTSQGQLTGKVFSSRRVDWSKQHSRSCAHCAPGTC